MLRDTSAGVVLASAFVLSMAVGAVGAGAQESATVGEGSPTETGPCASVTPLVLVDYANGDTEPSEASRTALDRIADSAKAEGCPLHVIGFAADRSTARERSVDVATARTEAVLKQLLERGVEPANVIHEVGGLTREFGPAAANRRVEVAPRPGAGRRCSVAGDTEVPQPLSITDFQAADAAISVAAEDLIETFATAIRNTGCRIAVTGYSSPDGRRTANEKLAADRASRVASLLEIKGIAAARIDIRAVGSTSRFGTKEANRRVVVSVQ